MNATTLNAAVERLEALRTELADQAFVLERGGRPEAADLALALRARLGEVCADLVAGEGSAGAAAPPTAVRSVYLPNSPLTALRAPAA